MVGSGTTAAPMAPRRPPKDVFILKGPPTYTFVVPTELSAIKNSADRPGRTLIVQGPSGSGKTTAVRRALDGCDGVLWLDAQKRVDRVKLTAIIESSEVPTHLVIDNFHRLEPPQRNDVADLIRVIADAGDSHITLMGINNVRGSLLSSNPEITGCVDYIKLREQPPEIIVEMVKRGAQEAGLDFMHIDDIVIAASGSLAVAQQLCLTAAEISIEQARVKASQEEDGGTLPEKLIVDVPVPEVVKRVVKSLDNTLSSLLEEFMRSGKESKVRCVYFCLLWLLARSEIGSASLREVSQSFEELEASVSLLGQVDFTVEVVSSGKLNAYFYLGSGEIAVDDPQLRFYLRHLHRIDGWNGLAARIGLNLKVVSDNVQFDEQGIGRGFEAPRVHVLDALDFPWDDDGALKFFHLIYNAYNEVPKMKILAETAGVKLDYWEAGAPEPSMRSLIKVACSQKKLRDLVKNALLDDNIKAYHDLIRIAIG